MHILIIFFLITMMGKWSNWSVAQSWSVPADFVQKKNPVVADHFSIQNGKRIYAKYCSPCHGEKGRANTLLAAALNPPPVDHTTKKFHQQTDGEIFYKIHTGRNSMPAYKHILTEKEIWDVINFIRTLGTMSITPGGSPTKRVRTSKKAPLSIPDVSFAWLANPQLLFLLNDTFLHQFPDTAIRLLATGQSENIAVEQAPPSTADTIHSQNEEKQRFLLTGSAHTNFFINGSSLKNTFFEVGFLPVFLWCPSERLFFESHLHLGIQGGNLSVGSSNSNGQGGHAHRTSKVNKFFHGNNGSGSPPSEEAVTVSSHAGISLSYANLVYFLHPSVMITGGIFLSPFGIFAERLHPEWIYKLPNAPIGMGHDFPILPETELGLQLRGGRRIGKMKFNYAAYFSNGPALIERGKDAGRLVYNNWIDNNSNKAKGGRIGWLPFASSSLEAGLSVQKARVGNDTTAYAGVDALLYAIDFSLFQHLPRIQGTLDVKAQYNVIVVDKVYYEADPLLTLHVPAEDVNLIDKTYRFDNTTRIFFLTLAYRPTTTNFLKNTEYVFRYDKLETPFFALWNQDAMRFTTGLVYWLDSRSAIKMAYQHSSGPVKNFFMFQWVIGL